MGTHRMGSNGGGTQQSKTDGLARQGSLYNLTLDEVQHQLGDLGKPLTSMNLDELLKSVFTAESQGMSGDYAQLASASSLPRQSNLNLSGDLSKKTVDEVWQNIQLGQKSNKVISSNNNNGGSDNIGFNRKTSAESQPTLGEMTLEDFLVKAGIVSASSGGKKNTIMGVDSIQNINPQQTQWMQYQIPSIEHQQHVFMPDCASVQQSLPLSANAIMETAYPESQMTVYPSTLMGTLSDTQMPGRKRVASGDVMEKTVERRQKRMIKNRESAARSRARKQAYTQELEIKISRLEEENERLKRQKEEEAVLPFVPPPELKYQLRRTSSAPF